MEKEFFNPQGDKTKQDAILRFFEETEIDKLHFDTRGEAEAHVNMVNEKYGDIAFVAEDRGKFSVRFKAQQIGEGFPEYNPSSVAENIDETLRPAA